MSEENRDLSDPLTEMQRRLELTYASVNEGIWDWDLRNDGLIWSDRFIEIVGLSRDQFTPQISTFAERIHPEDLPRVEQALDDHLKRGEPYDAQYRLRHEDGHYLHVRSRGQAFWDQNCNPVRMVGSVQDISDQVATKAALDESETRFRQLSANIPGAIFRYVIFPDGTDEIEYMSPGCLDIWEVDSATIEGDPTALWEVVLEEDFPAMRESVMRSAETLEPWSHKWRIQTKSGKRKWLHGRGLPSRLPDGSVLWNSLILDITDQVKTERELQENRELFHRAQKMESLGQLTGGMAHDFNNLLGIILGNLELLNEIGNLGESDEYVQDALNAVYRGSELTRSLLAFARRATLEPESTKLATVASELQQLLRHTLPGHIDLEMKLQSDLPDLVIDRGALESSLLNLILNARDAIEGEGRIEISFAKTTSEEPTGPSEHVQIKVTDNGTGMDPAVASKVIEPFFTTKEGGKGTGLGLSMVEGFVKQSGGAMRIDSELGEGTSMTLNFPVLKPEQAIAPRQPEPSDENLPNAQGVILVVEDEPDLRKILCNRLTAEGYTVFGAGDGSDAMAVAEELGDRLNLLLTDFILPGETQGPDLAATLRQQQENLAIVYLSGFVDISDAEDEDEYLRADARLLKPVGKIDLLRTVRRALTERAST